MTTFKSGFFYPIKTAPNNEWVLIQDKMGIIHHAMRPIGQIGKTEGWWYKKDSSNFESCHYSFNPDFIEYWTPIPTTIVFQENTEDNG